MLRQQMMMDGVEMDAYSRSGGILIVRKSIALVALVMSVSLPAFLGLGCLGIAGCGGAKNGSSDGVPSGRPPLPNDPAIFRIKGKELTAEVVFDDLSRKMGLMNRAKLEWNRGMLFIFPKPKQMSFWMKNTLIPLSIAFIDDEGTIRQIRHMKPKDLTSVGSKDTLRYALEMNKGWFEKEGIGVGDRFDGFLDTVSKFSVR